MNGKRTPKTAKKALDKSTRQVHFSSNFAVALTKEDGNTSWSTTILPDVNSKLHLGHVSHEKVQLERIRENLTNSWKKRTVSGEQDQIINLYDSDQNSGKRKRSAETTDETNRKIRKSD